MRLFPSMLFLLMLVPALALAQRSVDTDLSLEEQIVTYTPTKRDGVTDVKFKTTATILAEMRETTRGDARRLNAADYWNVASAFAMLNESNDMVGRVLTAGIRSCGDMRISWINGRRLVRKHRPIYNIAFSGGCAAMISGRSAFDPVAYATQNQLNKELVVNISEIGENDQKHRSHSPVDWRKQAALDRENQLAIQAMRRRYGRYTGRDLVGKRLETVMWAVAQHSNISMMREYLPVIQQAMTARRLDLTPLKMLIDRVQTIDTGVQIFGSQVGVPLADDATRAAVKARYGIS